jgi:CHAT domain-containing protein
MWSVNDASTMMLMTRFYEHWRKDHLEPAAASREAQRWVRDTTNRGKAEYYKELVPQLQTASKMAWSTAERLYQETVLREPDGREFAHPYCWAGFSYFGI